MSEQLGTSELQPSLQAELHAATRKQHMTLNQNITTRLPLCLPPHATNPTTYAKGMTVFGTIYVGFERAWNAALVESSAGSLDERHREILKRLQTPGLRRTDALQHDLKLLRSTWGRDAYEELDILQIQCQRFLESIQTSISNCPYLTLAYAWTMYLALFNGGRWLLRQLASPGPEFWQESIPLGSEKIEALSFWYFDSSTRSDGEDLKLAFKSNFESAAALLTDDERNDVVAEGQKLFDLCSEMIEFLDQHELQRQQNTDTSQTGGFGKTFETGFFATATRVWQTIRSTAIAYVEPTFPKPLREEVRPVE